MIFKFGRKQFSDVVKVVAFLDREKIAYEVITDIEVALGDAGEAHITAHKSLTDDVSNDGPKMTPTVEPVRLSAPSGLWMPAGHDGKVCNDTACLSPAHQGAQPLGS